MSGEKIPRPPSIFGCEYRFSFYACYGRDGQINPDGVRAMARYLKDKGVKGLYVGGSSGECIYQGVAERKLVLEHVMDEVGKDDDPGVLQHLLQQGHRQGHPRQLGDVIDHEVGVRRGGGDVVPISLK